jgi:hypothetical protein
MRQSSSVHSTAIRSRPFESDVDDGSWFDLIPAYPNPQLANTSQQLPSSFATTHLLPTAWNGAELTETNSALYRDHYLLPSVAAAGEVEGRENLKRDVRKRPPTATERSRRLTLVSKAER